MRCLSAVALVSVLSVVPAARGAVAARPLDQLAGARGAVSARPLDQLVAARGALKALAGRARTSAARRAVLTAETDVGRSTAPTLWLDARHVVAPPYGLSVFRDSRAALLALERVPGGALPSGAVAAVAGRILAGDRAVTVGAITQALGGSGGLLARARGMVLSGDRWAQTSRLDLATEQYGVGWTDAFQALTELVVLRAASVSPSAVGSAAANALRTRPLTPAGVSFVRGRARLELSGKPAVMFVGTESCRFCAIERWGLVVALSRFGVFSNLHLSQSETTAPPVVRSFTFAGAHYRSPYVSLVAVELSGEIPRAGGGFAPLNRLTAPERSLFSALDPGGVTPFVDVANRTRDVGATVSPTPLAGSPWGALAASLHHPRTAAGQAIGATAEVLTAEICRATGGAPSSVCDGAVVKDYASRLGRFGRRAAGCADGNAGGRNAGGGGDGGDAARRGVVRNGP